MNIRNLIKVISVVSALLNLFSPLKAAQPFLSETKKYPQIKDISPKESFAQKNNVLLQQRLSKKYKDNLIKNTKDKHNKTSRKDVPLFLANFTSNRNELEILSEIQSEKNNILSAEGNVLVSYKGNLLKANRLTYDKNKQIIFAEGNVALSIGEQIFNMDSLKYDFKTKKGYLLDVKGLIKAENLIDDLFYNFENSDIKKTEILEEIIKDKVRHTPNSLDNWIFFTDEIQIDGNKWTSAKATLTNDLLEVKQVKILVNSIEAIAREQELRFKSSVNYLILDEKIHIPFWFGKRTLTREIKYENKWNIGFDNIDKDGFYIGRKLNSINLSDDFIFDLEPQFLIQRSIQGDTKSFVSKGDSITGVKVRRDASIRDYFALNSRIKGDIDNWTLEINQQNNSFDPEKLPHALRFKSSLSKDITLLNSTWQKSFYSIYRDRVWNGSIGETEIYLGYGSKLEKQNSWLVDGISKTERLSLGLANLKAESLNSNNLVKTVKGNVFYSLDQNVPIKINEPINKDVDISYKYIPEPVKTGLSLNTKLELFYSFYDGGNNQQYLGFGTGPELVFGDFKKKVFDYTKISLLPFYKVKSGESIFKFDQISDKFTLDIAFDQQLFGPLILENTATLNIDSDSKDYGNFINSSVSLNWKKRSYEFGIFYQPHNEAGGIAFTLFGFD